MPVTFTDDLKIMKAAGIVSDTAENLLSSTKIIPDGVWLKESDTGKIKIGDDTHTYEELNYVFDGLKTGLPLFWCFYHRNTILHPSYIQAEQFSWHAGAIFVTAYNTLEQEYNNAESVEKTEQIGSVSLTYKVTPAGFKICNSDQQTNVINIFNATGQADFFIIDTTNKFFKLPRVPWSKYKGNNDSSVDYQQYFFVGNSIESDSEISLTGVIQIVEELQNNQIDTSNLATKAELNTALADKMNTDASNADPALMPVTGGIFTGSVQFNAGVFQNIVSMTSNTIDLSKGSTFSKTITAATTFSCVGVPENTTTIFTLVLTNGGNYTVTWPSSFKWSDGTPPELTSGGTDILTFITIDGGTTWYGSLSMSAVA